MNECPSQLELQLLSRGELPGQQCEVWFAHLSRCANCRGQFEGLLERDPILASLKSWSRRPLPEELITSDTRLVSLIGQVTALHTSSAHCEAGNTDAGNTASGNTAAGDTAVDLPAMIACYRVTGLLGSGGMSSVLRAEDQRLKRAVALKLIRADRVDDPHYVMRFQREAEAIARLDHPNILRIYESGQHAGRPYLALELVEAGSLADWMDGTPIDPRIAAELTGKLAGGLAAAHGLGIVHRDLKPSNILLQQRCKDGNSSDRADSVNQGDQDRLAQCEPKIADFGLAKQLDESAMTHTGQLLGTPAYMAPELTRGQRLDRQTLMLSDLYALGAILYELLTGRAPFVAATVADTFEQLRNREPLPPRQLLPKLPRDLETICLKCLNKEPTERYASAAELADELQRFLSDRPIHARPISSTQKTWRWARQRPALSGLMVGLAITLLAALVGGVLYQRQLEQALRQAQASQAQAQGAQALASQAYLSAKSTLESMLAVIEDRSLTDQPRMRQLQRQQLEAALQFYQQIADVKSDDRTIEFDAARAAMDAARLQEFLGSNEAARDNYEAAIERLTRLSRLAPDDVEYAIALADALIGRGTLAGQRRDYDAAVAAAQMALDILSHLPASAPGIPVIEAQVRVHHFLGAQLMQWRDTRTDEAGMQLVHQALVHSRASHDLLEKLVQQEPHNRQRLTALARTQINLSIIYQQFPEFMEQCRQFHALAESSLKELFTTEPTDIAIASHLAILAVNWAFVQDQAGQLEEAIADLDQAIARLEPLYANETDHLVARDALYRAHGVRAQVLDALERYEQSRFNWEGCVKYSPNPNTHRVSWAYALARSGHIDSAQEQLSLDAAAHAGNMPALNLWWAARTKLAAALNVAGDASRAQGDREAKRATLLSEASALLDQLQRIATAEELDKYAKQASELAEFQQLPAWPS